MKVVHYQDIVSTRIDNEKARGISGRVVIGSADGAPFCMRVFEIEKDGHTPRHTHPWEHEIFFHNGQGQVYCRGEWHAVRPGSVAFVKENEEHQIKNAGGEPLIFVCLIPKGAPEL